MPSHVLARSDVDGVRTLDDELGRKLETFHRLAVGARVLLVIVFGCAVLGAFCLVMAELLTQGFVSAAASGLASHVGPLPM